MAAAAAASRLNDASSSSIWKLWCTYVQLSDRCSELAAAEAKSIDGYC